MFRPIFAALAAAQLLASSTASGETLVYEPTVVTVSGTIFSGKAEHPNGAWMNFLALRLRTPASIEESPGDSLNVAESNVREIQVYARDAALRKRLEQRAGKAVTLRGTIFHAHTAWHVRPLVMTVQELK